ncbi:hypothetical protein [Emticicia agri]|uniref:Bacterial surface antigen (D15) domain-containing protein n=1 Tax=Emticicia agri TaxID=2492393 RepID=A0A4Q5M5J9_9BACT|nr:hypothetical protein [Emticicia agri]RYU97525.1 hypothetical protein EWM59_02195 [Emticicia agri]
MKSKHFLYIPLLFTAFQLTAQNGPQPASMKWKYIENDKVKVIFPEENQAEAIRIADLVTYVNKNATVSVGNKSKKLDILLNTNNAQGNGYVALSPYRSEFYATGFQDFNDLGSMDWLDALAIHEYRHALQFTNANRGFTKFLYLLQGQSGWSLGANFSIPDWYFEGDAVLAETVLSGAGRGRTPSFFDEQRALLLSDKNYTYSQARNGSFKKLLPNHYPLGYAILNYGRNHFGPEMWPKVLADAGRYRTILYPFAGALRRHTKIGVNKMYRLAYREMKENWENEIRFLKLTSTSPITPLPKRTVTNYTFPHWLEDGSLLCIKSSFKQISALYQIKDGKQKYLAPIGAATEGYLGVNNNKVAWTEMRKDARRDAVIYSVIMSYDLQTGQRTQVTQKSKFFSPQFSSTGDRIIAVKADENINNELCIISPDNGSIVSTIPNPENDFISYPKWTTDDASIVYLARRKSKIAMLKYDLASKQTTELTPWTTHTISGLSISDKSAIFGASFSGINNIYAVNLNGDKQITQLSSVRIGATLPAISKDEKKLAMVEMTAMGRQLTQLDVKSIGNAKVTEPVNMERFHVKTTEIEHDIQYQTMENSYQVKNYKGLLRGVKLHSWTFGSSDNRNLNLSVQLGNILNDFSAVIASQYNYNEKTIRFSGGFDYGRFFLPLSFRASTGNRANTVFLNPDFLGTLSYKQDDINVGLSLPLSWMKGNYTTSFRLSSTFSNISTSAYKIQDTPINHGLNFNALQFGLNFSNVRRKARQNLVNKWSQNISLSYQKSITAGTSAERMIGSVGFTTPGFGKNHGLEVAFRGKQELLNNNYLFEDQFLHARGYAAAPGDVETVISTTYSLPLFNVDRGFAGIFFLNRVRANVFYDYGNIERKFINFKTLQRSYGAEVIFDIKLLNTVGPLGFGLRNAFLLDTDPLNPTTKQRFEFFVASNL